MKFVVVSLLLLLGHVSMAVTAGTSHLRCLYYLTGQHYEVPDQELLSEVTHVALAFMPSDIFNQETLPTTWPLFTTVEKVRTQFPAGVQVLIAVGGWGDTTGFSLAAKTDGSRRLFARNIKAMLDVTGADGVDIDWEYPGGNGEDYKRVPNTERKSEIETYPLLLSAIRSALDDATNANAPTTRDPRPHLLLTAAVPGHPRDMLAFTKSTIPAILPSIDFFNVMTYDLMNRRDNATTHHTGVWNSRRAIEAYAEMGVPHAMMNLGFGFYIRWYRTLGWRKGASTGGEEGGTSLSEAQQQALTVRASDETSTHLREWKRCHDLGGAEGCKTPVMEDPETGGDLGLAGAFARSDEVPTDLRRSFARAMTVRALPEDGSEQHQLLHDSDSDSSFNLDPDEGGHYDDVHNGGGGGGGGRYFWDDAAGLWWSWDGAHEVRRKVRDLVVPMRLGGVFAWGLGEDAGVARGSGGSEGGGGSGPVGGHVGWPWSRVAALGEACRWAKGEMREGQANESRGQRAEDVLGEERDEL